MNLRELLLQLAGNSGEVIKLDELLRDKVKGIEVEEEIESGVRLILNNPADLDEVKERIEDVLEQNGYGEYSIEPEKDGPVYHILVIANK